MGHMEPLCYMWSCSSFGHSLPTPYCFLSAGPKRPDTVMPLNSPWLVLRYHSSSIHVLAKLAVVLGRGRPRLSVSSRIFMFCDWEYGMVDVWVCVCVCVRLGVCLRSYRFTHVASLGRLQRQRETSLGCLAGPPFPLCRRLVVKTSVCSC